MMADFRGRLNGKIAMVTGGGSGIGRAICQLFAEEGARLAIVDINENSATETLNLLNRCDEHVAIKANVTVADDVERAFMMAEEKFGEKFDIVVNNAGIVGKQNFVSDIEEESYDRVVGVSLKGVFLVAKHYLNSVKGVDKDVRGVLINMSSMAANIGLVCNGEYSAAKAGVVALTKTIAKEFSVHRVRCNAVQPGFTDTTLLDKLNQEVKSAVAARIPMERNGTPREIANGFLYLASDESSYVHGTCLEISGGL